jgi:hypothetical protein
LVVTGSVKSLRAAARTNGSSLPIIGRRRNPSRESVRPRLPSVGTLRQPRFLRSVMGQVGGQPWPNSAPDRCCLCCRH